MTRRKSRNDAAADPPRLCRGDRSAARGAAPLVLNPFSVTLLNYIGIYCAGRARARAADRRRRHHLVRPGRLRRHRAPTRRPGRRRMHGYSPWLGLVLALVLTCSVAAVLGSVTLRLGGHFLSLSTVAWGLAISSCSATSTGSAATTASRAFRRSPRLARSGRQLRRSIT